MAEADIEKIAAAFAERCSTTYQFDPMSSLNAQRMHDMLPKDTRMDLLLIGESLTHDAIKGRNLLLITIAACMSQGDKSMHQALQSPQQVLPVLQHAWHT